MKQPIEVAVLLPEEKAQKLRLSDRVLEAGLSDVQFTRMTLEELLASGSRFRAVLHKIHADLISDDPSAVDRVRRFKAWLAERGSSVAALDPLQGLETMLLYRLDQCRAMSKCVEADLLKDRVFVPRFALVKQPRDDEAADEVGSLRFPLLCKPHIASGAEAHQMSLVFTREQLGQLRTPVVAQEFVNHGARLIKVYVLGDAVYACIRPSLRDFPPDFDGPAIEFSSHAVSKAGSKSDLSRFPGAASGDTDTQLLERHSAILAPLAARCRSVLGLDLINLDLVPDTATGRLALVDINQFPGFEAMPNYVLALAQLVRQKCGSTAEVGSL